MPLRPGVVEVTGIPAVVTVAAAAQAVDAGLFSTRLPRLRDLAPSVPSRSPTRSDRPARADAPTTSRPHLNGHPEMSTQTCRVRKAATALRFALSEKGVAFATPGGT